MALNELGEVAMNTGAEPEAERLFHESIAMGERGNDTMHRDMGDPLQNLDIFRPLWKSATSNAAISVLSRAR